MPAEESDVVSARALLRRLKPFNVWIAEEQRSSLAIAVYWRVKAELEFSLQAEPQSEVNVAIKKVALTHIGVNPMKLEEFAYSGADEYLANIVDKLRSAQTWSDLMWLVGDLFVDVHLCRECSGNPQIFTSILAVIGGALSESAPVMDRLSPDEQRAVLANLVESVGWELEEQLEEAAAQEGIDS